MYNTEDLARIRRQELLIEASVERLARAARARPCDGSVPVSVGRVRADGRPLPQVPAR
jgi:hypothetical protein